MDDHAIAEELVRELARPDGSPKLRPVHTIGVGVTGHFRASDIAGEYCKAAHFQGDVIPVTMRFSNGSGSATPHDGWSDVRGMATRFHLPDGSATDLVCMTLPEFFAPTPKTFLDFTIAAKPVPVQRESPWNKFVGMLRLMPPMPDPYPGETISPNPGGIAYANAHAHAQLAVFEAASIGAPQSYARASYHAVHTFIVTGADGVRRWVRFTWQPVAGVLNTDPLKTPEDEYLQAEMRARLAKGTARFTLTMVIGETGDAFSDSTRPWPPHRRRIEMGELTLEHVPQDQIEGCERLSFNPWLLTEGIEPSDDPILHVRKHAYEYSAKLRGGNACPFSRS